MPLANAFDDLGPTLVRWEVGRNNASSIGSGRAQFQPSDHQQAETAGRKGRCLVGRGATYGDFGVADGALVGLRGPVARIPWRRRTSAIQAAVDQTKSCVTQFCEDFLGRL